jgi:hypothetical protein
MKRERRDISLQTIISITGTRLIEISGTLAGMFTYAAKPIETLVGTHALYELRELHAELGIALERFEADYPDEVRRSRGINRKPQAPAPEVSP